MLILDFVPYIILLIVLAVVLYNSITIASGDQIITLERRWLGKDMPDGRTVALKDEVGVQARILSPGLHVLVPFLFEPPPPKVGGFLGSTRNRVDISTSVTSRCTRGRLNLTSTNKVIQCAEVRLNLKMQRLTSPP
jgi:hypothetical protein